MGPVNTSHISWFTHSAVGPHIWSALEVNDTEAKSIELEDNSVSLFYVSRRELLLHPVLIGPSRSQLPGNHPAVYGPSWQTAANEAEVVGRVRVLQKRAMQPLFSCLTHLELHLQPPVTLVLICTCNLIYFLPASRVLAECINSHVLHSPTFYTITISLNTQWLIFTQKKYRSIILICSHKVSECKRSLFLFWKWRCKDTDGIHANMTNTVLIAAHESRSGHTYRSCTANVPSNLFGHTGNSMGNRSYSHVFSIYFQKPQFVTVKHWANGVCTSFFKHACACKIKWFLYVWSPAIVHGCKV